MEHPGKTTGIEICLTSFLVNADRLLLSLLLKLKLKHASIVNRLTNLSSQSSLSDGSNYEKRPMIVFRPSLLVMFSMILRLATFFLGRGRGLWHAILLLYDILYWGRDKKEDNI